MKLKIAIYRGIQRKPYKETAKNRENPQKYLQILVFVSCLTPLDESEGTRPRSQRRVLPLSISFTYQNTL
jgi:hypothetical protein